MAGRHGNKGLFRIMPEEDMPFLPDGIFQLTSSLWYLHV